MGNVGINIYIYIYTFVVDNFKFSFRRHFVKYMVLF